MTLKVVESSPLERARAIAVARNNSRDSHESHRSSTRRAMRRARAWTRRVVDSSSNSSTISTAVMTSRIARQGVAHVDGRCATSERLKEKQTDVT